jgi:2-aminophenol/2-amino-5-chlorophenol 1,6-dioxygenase alpha subunit
VSAAHTPIGVIVPGLPQPLLCPEKNEGWTRLRRGFEAARAEIAASGADLLVVYSTMWPSIIGHQIQADPKPVWVHVDELFHMLGSIPYEFRIDAPFAEQMRDACEQRGLAARTVAYHGFPIDTGSVVALKLLNPNNELPAVIVSSNIYSDRAETVVLGKATRDAIAASGRKAAIVVVATLSNRLFTDWIDPATDHVHSPKDDEWNRKLLEFLGAGRLEDTAQLSREIHRQVRVHKVVSYKPLWWMSAVMGQHNRYQGNVHAYAAIHGTGGAVVTLVPTEAGVGDKEFDEEDVEFFSGDRNVIAGAPGGRDPGHARSGGERGPPAPPAEEE